MPGITNGSSIGSSAQINAGVIDNSDIADNIIETGKIKDETIQSIDIEDGEIVNADISASAGIVDTKLATISTAGKVSGAALTSLANTPAGAGVIPAANLPGGGKVIPAVSVISSTTATELLNYTIPANTLGTGNVIRFKIPIWEMRKTGTGAANAVYITFDGTNFCVMNPDNNAATYNGDRGYIEGEIWGDGSTSAQKCMLKISHGQDNNASAATQWWTSSHDGAPTKNSTGALVLKVMWSNGTNSSNDYIHTGVGILETITV